MIISKGEFFLRFTSGWSNRATDRGKRERKRERAVAKRRELDEKRKTTNKKDCKKHYLGGGLNPTLYLLCNLRIFGGGDAAAAPVNEGGECLFCWLIFDISVAKTAELFEGEEEFADAELFGITVFFEAMVVFLFDVVFQTQTTNENIFETKKKNCKTGVSWRDTVFSREFGNGEKLILIDFW